VQQIFSDIGYFRGVLVALKHIRKEHIQLSRNVLLEFNEVSCMVLRSLVSRLVYSKILIKRSYVQIPLGGPDLTVGFDKVR